MRDIVQYPHDEASSITTCLLIERQYARVLLLRILVWPTCRTAAVGGLLVCESVCPKACRHIARRMING